MGVRLRRLNFQFLEHLMIGFQSSIPTPSQPKPEKEATENEEQSRQCGEHECVRRGRQRSSCRSAGNVLPDGKGEQWAHETQ